MRVERLCVFVCLAALPLVACSEKDETPPPPPRVHPIDSPTASSTITVTGAAEYGATVNISGGKAPVSVEADPFTAEFLAEVELNTDLAPGEASKTNSLSFTATDSAGNTSEPTVVDVVFGPPPGAAAVLNFELTGSAAGGQLEAGEDLTYSYTVEDAYGDPALDPVLVVVNAPDTAVLDDSFSGTGMILGLTKAGTYTVTARVPGSGLVETRTITVVPASGERVLTLTMTLTDMAVGDITMALTVVRDIYGNRIDTPLPTYAVDRQSASGWSPATTVSHPTAVDNEFAFSAPGVYRVTATFNDGSNPAGSDFAYIVVHPDPDVEAPVVSIDNVNGRSMCAAGTLYESFVTADPADCTQSPGPLVFRNNTVIVVNVLVSDNRALSEVRYSAFGAGTEFSGSFLVGSGQYTAGSTIPVAFDFTARNNWYGDIAIVAQAIDAAGNVANSNVAKVRVGLDVRAGNRMVMVEAASAALTNPQGIAVAPSSAPNAGEVFIANRDWGNEFILQPSAFVQAVSTFFDFNPVQGARPAYVAVDGLGNVYVTLDNANTIWQIAPDGTGSQYQASIGGWNPEGLATMGAIPARGRWNAGGPLTDHDCLSIQTGASSTYLLEVVQNGTSCTGTCSNAFAGTPDDCKEFSAGATPADQRNEVAAKLNTVRATTGVSAFAATGCNTNNGGGGTPCLFLIADSLGTQPPPAGSLPITLDSSSAAWTPVDVDDGADDGTLFVADRNADRVYELATPPDPAAPTAPRRTYDFSNLSTSNQNLRDVAPALRLAGGDDANLSPRLFLFGANDRGDPDSAVFAYDSGRNRYWELTTGNVTFRHLSSSAQDDRLNNPRAIVYVPKNSAGGDCVLVGSNATGNWSNGEEILAYADLDGSGAAPEGGLPLATGFRSVNGLALDMTDADPQNWSLLVTDANAQVVVRIFRSADPGDCF